jgi:hypothetical protein
MLNCIFLYFIQGLEKHVISNLFLKTDFPSDILPMTKTVIWNF